MTFFNKKTEVMQIEMTPYGRYLYSIGKFKPHSYEFVDDDINYKVSGEAQEDAHNRILNETPKLKINRSFQDEAPQVESPSLIRNQRKMIIKNDQKNPSLFSLGKSSYSGAGTPNFQVSMLLGQISGSSLVHEVSSSQPPGVGSISGSVFIPQIDIDLNFVASLKNNLLEPVGFSNISSDVADDGTYIELRYEEPIIHIKEFNSFYEKENFEIQVFKLSEERDQMVPLYFADQLPNIVNDLFVEESIDLQFESSNSPNEVNFYFEFQMDSEISQEELCSIISKLEINNQFLDEELICPDIRDQSFDIYGTRVGPEDLEDCD